MLTLVDSLQQQVKNLSEYKVSSKQFGELYDKAIAVVRQNEINKKKADDNYRALLEDTVQLRDQLAERDRTIALLTKELEVDNEMLESMVGQEREDDNDEAVRLRKALEDAREAVTHLTGEHPTELWTKSEVDGWRGIGESAIDNINQALGE